MPKQENCRVLSIRHLNIPVNGPFPDTVLLLLRTVWIIFMKSWITLRHYSLEWCITSYFIHRCSTNFLKKKKWKWGPFSKHLLQLSAIDHTIDLDWDVWCASFVLIFKHIWILLTLILLERNSNVYNGTKGALLWVCDCKCSIQDVFCIVL